MLARPMLHDWTHNTPDHHVWPDATRLVGAACSASAHVHQGKHGAEQLWRCRWAPEQDTQKRQLIETRAFSESLEALRPLAII